MNQNPTEAPVQIDAQQAYLQHERKKRLIALIVCIPIAAVLIVFGLLFDTIFPPKPEVVTYEGLSITLTDRFSKKTYDGEVCWEADDILVMFSKDTKSSVGEFTSLLELAQAMEKNLIGEEDYAVAKSATSENGLVYYEYTYQDLLDRFTYGVYLYEDGGYYYSVIFSTDTADYDDFRTAITEYAKSVTFE